MHLICGCGALRAIVGNPNISQVAPAAMVVLWPATLPTDRPTARPTTRPTDRGSAPVCRSVLQPGKSLFPRPGGCGRDSPHLLGDMHIFP